MTMMIGSVHLLLPTPPRHLNHRWNQQRPPFSPPQCSLTKQTQRFLTSLAATAVTEDSSAANRLIRKFVSSSGKSTSLDALAHLLSPTNPRPGLSLLALPLYTRITEESWFNWNAKLVAELIALLVKQERFAEAETLLDATLLKLGFCDREIARFYCDLIDFHSKHKSKQHVFDAYACLTQLGSYLSSVYLKQRGYEAVVCALCVMDLPAEADWMVMEMREKGLKPSLFGMRSVVYGYGRSGMFEDMLRNVDWIEKQGFAVDTICANMVLSSYGAHNKLGEMVSWLRRMKGSGITFSTRSYNSVLNACPTIMSMLQETKKSPVSLQELEMVLSGDEALMVQELTGSSTVLGDAMEWGLTEAKLDLHGMHLGTAYLIMLQWMKEVATRFKLGEHGIPANFTVVCGSGKHSIKRGESPVKSMVKDVMVRTGSPMRIDRKNIGCFIAKGQAVKDWLR